MKFAALLLATSAIATPVLTSKRWTSTVLNEIDFEIVNLARNLESLELAYWNQALKNFSAADWNNANYTGAYDIITLFRDQEIAHFTVLNELAGGNFTNCTYTFDTPTPMAVLAMAQVVTTVGEGAFIGAEGNLTNPAARQGGGSILGNEARQNSKLRELLGLDYFNAVNFDTALSASQAYSLAEPFFKCPSSNAPISFTLIPPLMANFTGNSTVHKAGDAISVMWNATAIDLGTDVHINFLADVYSIPAPLNQTGTGMGMTTLPAGINGTAFLVATNFQGQGPIPDEQNFAIGYVVVA